MSAYDRAINDAQNGTKNTNGLNDSELYVYNTKFAEESSRLSIQKAFDGNGMSNDQYKPQPLENLRNSESLFPLWVVQAFWLSFVFTLVLGLPLLKYIGPFGLFIPGAFWFGLFYFFMGRQNTSYKTNDTVLEDDPINAQKQSQHHIDTIERLKSDFEKGIRRPAPELHVQKKRASIPKSQLVPLIFAGLLVLLLIVVKNLHWFF